MSIDLNSFKPRTLDEAISALCSNLNEEERDAIRGASSMTEFHHGVGTAIRNAWLWDANHPLHMYFVRVFGLGHADDMSGIILDGVEARVTGTPFEPHELARKYKDYWLKLGIDPLTQEEIVAPPSKGILRRFADLLKKPE